MRKAMQLYNDGYMRKKPWVKYGDDEYTLKIHRCEKARERAYGRLNNYLTDLLR